MWRVESGGRHSAAGGGRPLVRSPARRGVAPGRTGSRRHHEGSFLPRFMLCILECMTRTTCFNPWHGNFHARGCGNTCQVMLSKVSIAHSTLDALHLLWSSRKRSHTLSKVMQ